MEQQFWAYYSPTKDQLQKLWQDCFFVIDTSVLLELYQHSPQARDEFFEILENTTDRVWLPHQVALEYHRNRVQVMHAHRVRYDDLAKSPTNIKKLIKTTFRGTKGLDDLMVAVEQLEKAIRDFRPLQSAVGMRDPEDGPDEVRDKLNDVLGSGERIGSAYGHERLEEIYAEGKHRYERGVPPGFSDFSTKPEPNCYGDLVIWFQVIDQAKVRGQSAVLVINDTKEDWCQVKGRDNKAFAPRPELREEIKEKAEVDCHFYSLEGFLSDARKYAKAEVSKETISEVAAAAEERRRPSRSRSPFISPDTRAILAMANENAILRANLDPLQELRNSMTSQQALIEAMTSWSKPSNLIADAASQYALPSILSQITGEHLFSPPSLLSTFANIDNFGIDDRTDDSDSEPEEPEAESD